MLRSSHASAMARASAEASRKGRARRAEKRRDGSFELCSDEFGAKLIGWMGTVTDGGRRRAR